MVSLMLTAVIRFYPNTEPAQKFQQANTHVLPESITYVGPDRRPVIQMPADRRDR